MVDTETRLARLKDIAGREAQVHRLCLICGCEVVAWSGSVYLLDNFFGALRRIAYCHDACKVTLDARTEVRGPEAT